MLYKMLTGNMPLDSVSDIKTGHPKPLNKRATKHWRKSQFWCSQRTKTEDRIQILIDILDRE